MLKSKAVLLVWCIVPFVCVAANPPPQSPVVRLDAIHYRDRDLDEINRVLDDFDNQIARSGINLATGGYDVELRLVKKQRRGK